MTSSLLVKIMQDTGARVPTSLGFYAGLNDSDYAYEKPLPAIDFDLDNTGDRHENSGLEPRPFSSPTIGRVPLEPSEDTPNTPGKPRKPRKPRKQATTAPKAPVTPAAKGSTSETKVCSQCGGRKPATLEHFAQHNATRDRLTQHCRICRSANNKARRSRDPIMRLRHHFSTRISATVPDCPAGYVADLELTSDTNSKTSSPNSTYNVNAITVVPSSTSSTRGITSITSLRYPHSRSSRSKMQLFGPAGLCVT